MKISKSLFLAFAGLGLFACSNEDVTENGGIQGGATVMVQINTAQMSRTMTSPTSSLAVTGTAKVTLQTADGPISKPITLNGQSLNVEFPNVNAPGNISINVNNYSSDGIALTTMNGEGESVTNAGLNAPMYAEANVVTTSGWTFDDESKTYRGTLTPQHTQVARLEFSGIKHVKDGNEACWFKSITFDGLFLNKIKGSTNGNAITAENWNDVITTNATSMPCYDVISGGNSFLNDGEDAIVYPENGKCYAYNIVAGDKPTLTLCFSNIVLSDAKVSSGAIWPTAGLGYATVATYKAKGSDIKGNAAAFGVTTAEEQIQDDTMYEINNFPAGYIYRVTDLSVMDKNIGQTIDGKPVNVVATISIVDWKLVTGEIEWGGSN